MWNSNNQLDTLCFNTNSFVFSILLNFKNSLNFSKFIKFCQFKNYKLETKLKKYSKGFVTLPRILLLVLSKVLLHLVSFILRSKKLQFFVELIYVAPRILHLLLYVLIVISHFPLKY